MTTNQIAFYDATTRRMAALEGARHNVEDEKIRSRANEISDFSAYSTDQHYQRGDAINEYSAHQTAAHYERQDRETARHNVVSEQLGYDTLAETKRHNLAGESISSASLTETQRHNLQTEKRDFGSLAESVRHNKAQEDIGYQNVGLGYANVDLGYSKLAEESRHNQAYEGYLNWSALLDNTIKQNTLHETERSNMAREAETTRHNQELESQGRTGLDYEFIRATSQSRQADAAESQAQTAAINAETNAYNAGTERYDMYRRWLDTFGNVYKLYTSGNTSTK